MFKTLKFVLLTVIGGVIALALLIFPAYLRIMLGRLDLPEQVFTVGYLCGSEQTVAIYDADMQPLDPLPRGQAVEFTADIRGTRLTAAERDGLVQLRVIANAAADTDTADTDKTVGSDEAGVVLLTAAENVCTEQADVIPDHTLYVRSSVNLCSEDMASLLPVLAPKGDALSVKGFDYVEEDGSIHAWLVEYNGCSGFIRDEYVCDTAEEAAAQYREGGAAVHGSRGDPFGGGTAATLDYYPRSKNAADTMPDEVRAYYLGAYPGVLEMVDDYIELADSCGVNAFVVDITDTRAMGYASPVMQKYSPTAYAAAMNTAEEYASAIAKLKAAGYYTIGRITTFNDPYFVQDNPQYAISRDGSAYRLAGSYWPSAYCREVWEYKVELALEAVELCGFDEIQFDYVRFPEYCVDLERSGGADFHNSYGETRAQAIQRFLMYACDRLHEQGIYVSADVFGEVNQNYVTAYGQYWPAISNVVDAISGMPYPDHYGAKNGYYPWQHPYDTLYKWGCEALERQAETPTPAQVRTWIQAYDSIRAPYVSYGAENVAQEIRGLRDAGVTGGFMTWNASSSYAKYKAFTAIF